MLFGDEDFQDTQHLIEAIGKRGRFYGACDPSLGRSTKNDYTAIIVLPKDMHCKIMYVIAADLIHCTPDHTLQRIMQYT